MSVVSKLANDVKLPKMIKVQQIFNRESLAPTEIPSEVNKLLSHDKFKYSISEGKKICITCGSRGISNIALITKSIVDYCKKVKAKPFVIPAMGSHGGATAEGQRKMLEGFGVTEEYIGCPIYSSMETVEIGKTDEGTSVFIDKYASESDGIIVCGRVKPHTCFRGNYESGIMKMMAIGLGKQHGAEVCHEKGFKNMAKNVHLFGRAIISNAPIVCGFAILENPYDETRRLVALGPDEIEEKEPELLNEARENMPKIYFENTDVLIVDKIGKNFSGDGMDPNITGTFATPYASGGINAENVVVLDLSDESHGSAVGIGGADAITKRLFDKIDFEMTYPNVITATTIKGSKIPMILKSDKEAIQIALRTTVDSDKNNPRMIRIKNSLQIDEIYISEAHLNEAKNNPNIKILGESMEFPFDGNGNLPL